MRLSHKTKSAQKSSQTFGQICFFSSELIAGQLNSPANWLQNWLRRPKTQKTTPKDGLKCPEYREEVAEPTGLEPATSDVTGRRSNQLNYDSAIKLLIFKCGPPLLRRLGLVGTEGLEPTTSTL